MTTTPTTWESLPDNDAGRITIGRLVAWLDANGGRTEHEITLRILKLAEEVGEVTQARLGVLGQNPRKGTTHTAEDVADELCDVIVTAMVALGSVVTDPAGHFARKVAEVAAKRGASGEDRAPDFYQPGTSYSHRDGTDFRCVTVTTHPNTGERRALGWAVRNGWHEPAAMDPDDWAHSDGCEPPAGDPADESAAKLRRLLGGGR
jgi:NTP pyrophosphatase (non-canonical NTP hydrolase)